MKWKIPTKCEICNCDISEADIEEKNYTTYQDMLGLGRAHIAHEKCYVSKYEEG